MEEITWLDVLKVVIAAIAVIIPVAAVIIAAYYADKNSKKTVKLQAEYNRKHLELEARNKWKEDFRLHVSDLLESLINLNFTTIDYIEDTNKNCLTRETMTNASTAMAETNARFQKIRFMLENDSDSRELIEIVKAHDKELEDLMEGKINLTNLEETTEKICDVAKRIYDNKK